MATLERHLDTTMRYIILSACFIAAATAAVPRQPENNPLDDFRSLAAFRSKIESCAHDVQVTLPPKSPEVSQARQLYEEARDAYNEYLDATSVAATRGQLPSTILAFAEHAATLAMKFMTYAAAILKALNRSIEAEHTPPFTAFGVKVCERQHRISPALARTLQTQLTWAAWEDLQ